jgi:DNA-binding MarR family transcriptional regulator
MKLQSQALNKMLNVIKRVRKDYPEISVTHLEILMIILQSERLYMTDLSSRLPDLDKANLSQLCGLLSHYGCGKQKGGYGLINLIEDSTDRRYKIIVLTQKGKQLASDFEKILGE